MTPRPSAASQDSSHKRSAFSATSHTNDSSYSTTTIRGLDLSATSHSIAKHVAMKRGPIIRVVHVFSPKLIKTDVENFRTLVQQLTGNHSSKEAEEGQQQEATQPHELRHQKEKEAIMHAYNSPAVSSSSEVLPTQLEEHYDHPIVSHALLQAELASAYPGLTIYKEQSMACPPRLERINGEKRVHYPLDQFNQKMDYFRVANYSNDNGRYYCHDSPSSLDGLSSSTTRSEGSLKYERENDYTVFRHELDSMEGGFHLSDPFMGLDDQQYFLMGAAHTDFTSLDPTWS